MNAKKTKSTKPRKPTPKKGAAAPEAKPPADGEKRDAGRRPLLPPGIRIEKGRDIDAACGQFRLKQATAEGIV